MERHTEKTFRIVAAATLAFGLGQLMGCTPESSMPQTEQGIALSNLDETLRWMADQNNPKLSKSADILEKMKEEKISGGNRVTFINSGTASQDYARVVNMGNEQGEIIIVLSVDKFSQPDFSTQAAAESLNQAMNYYKRLKEDPRY